MKITDVIETKKYQYSLDEFKKLLNITDEESIDYITNMSLTDMAGEIYIHTKKIKQSSVGLDKKDKSIIKIEPHRLNCGCKSLDEKSLDEQNRTDEDRTI